MPRKCCIVEKLRRASAILIMTLFSATLITPAVFVFSRQELPACCRKDGSHHCSMSGRAGETGEESGAALRASPKCPFFPQTSAATACHDPALPLPAGSFLNLLARQTEAHAPSQTSYSGWVSHSHLTRGPPSRIY